MERLICLVIGYVLGNFQTAYICGKAKGIDIREHGSGNAGTTNSLRVLGRKAGAIVFAGDVLKCVLAVWIIKWVFGENHADIINVFALYAGVGTILGHNYPVVLNFKGGKGMACTAGFMLAYSPVTFLIGITIFLTVFFLTHYVSLGSIFVYIAFPIAMIIMTFHGTLGALSAPQMAEVIILSLFLSVMAIGRHADNIKRLLNGTEGKTYLSKKK